MKEKVSIFILIDALGWSYIQERGFLEKIAPHKQKVKSILGYSSGVIPSILTGKYPKEHKHWSLYFHSPQTSPFRWLKSFQWLPAGFLNTRLSRKIVEEISKRVMGYKGYFETYLIPVELLSLFDICEKHNIYKAGGIRGAESIFDILKTRNVDYRSFTYPMKDKDIFRAAQRELEAVGSEFYFLYLSESDALLHRFCNDKEKVEKMIDWYEEEIFRLYDAAKKNFKEVRLFVFSDHSMADVRSTFDLKRDIERLGFRVAKDYVPFYDSTFARFWFFEDGVKQKVVELLKDKDYGRILEKEELRRMGVDFEDDMYGEVIFLMKTGSVICPSFMGNKAPVGMHGFDVEDGSMDAVFVTNVEKEHKLEDVKDVFGVMMEEIGDR